MLLFLLLACNEPPPLPFDPAADSIRREALRETLKRKLGDTYSAEVPDLAQADPDRGQEIFFKSCSGCHGAGARGDGPRLSKLSPPLPPDLLDSERAAFLSDAAQMELIRSGSPGTAMPPMAKSLSEAHLLDAYAYIKALRAAVRQAEAGHR